MTVSRIRFNKWLIAYNQFKYDCDPEEGRDGNGRWIRFRNKKSLCVERLQFDTRRCSVSVMMNLRICDDEFTTCMCILLELQMRS